MFQVTYLPLGGVHKLQTNFYVTHIQDTLEKISAAAEASTISTNSSQTKIAALCGRHSNQPKSFFCHTCSVAICRDCIVLDHRDVVGGSHEDAMMRTREEQELDKPIKHIIQDIVEAESQQKDALGNSIETARAVLANMHSQINSIATEKGNLDTAKTSVLKTIQEGFKEFHKMLDSREEKLMKQAWDMYSEKEAHLKEVNEQYNQAIAKLNVRLESGEKFSQSGSLFEVINAKESLLTATEELKQSSSYGAVGGNYLTFDSAFGLDAFKVSVDVLSRVMSVGDLPSRVHYEFSCLVASLTCEVKMQVFGFHGNAKLKDYPIDILIYDPTEEVISVKQITSEDSTYYIQFVPQMSGPHHFVPLFLGEPIIGTDATEIIKSNNPVMKIGGLGNGEGKFSCPRAIACDPSGCVYVADTGNKLIQKFDADGKFLMQFAISAGTEDCSTCDLALNIEKGLIICTETMVGSGANPTMGNTVATYTTQGILKHKFSNKVMKCALCVATTSRHEIIISDYLVHSLFMYDEHGNFLRRIGNANAFNHPAFICVGEDDSVIVSDTNNDLVQIFDRQGQFKQQFGKSGNKKGCLKQPFGVADDGENFLVVDSGNRRIQVFSRQ